MPEIKFRSQGLWVAARKGAPNRFMDPMNLADTERSQRGEPASEILNAAKDLGTTTLAGIWLPPRDSNPDMLIQSQLSCR